MATLSREEQLELVRAARQGDQVAFGRLHALVAPLLSRTLYRMLPPDDVEDVVQESLIKAFARIDQFQGDAAFSTWCVSIGVNEALMRRRKIKREAEVIAMSLDETVTTDSGEQKAFEPGYEDRTAEQNLAFDTIHRGLAKLKPAQSLALQMHLNGESLEDICAALDLTLPATKSVIFRGKRALGEAITGVSGEVRLCKCKCGQEVPARGWPYVAGHGKQEAKDRYTEVAVLV